jgi:hypothetical protein
VADSCINDGGLGCLRALGVKLLDFRRRGAHGFQRRYGKARKDRYGADTPENLRYTFHIDDGL